MVRTVISAALAYCQSGQSIEMYDRHSKIPKPIERRITTIRSIPLTRTSRRRRPLYNWYTHPHPPQCTTLQYSNEKKTHLHDQSRCTTLFQKLTFSFLSPTSSRVRQPQPLLHRLHKNRRDGFVRSPDGKAVHLKRKPKSARIHTPNPSKRVMNIPYSQRSAPTATNTQTCRHSYAAP